MHPIQLNGVTYVSISHAAHSQKINYNTVRTRMSKGMSVRKALTTPVAPKNIPAIDHKGNRFKCMTDMARYWGIPADVFRQILKRDWDIERILTQPVRGRSHASSYRTGQAV